MAFYYHYDSYFDYNLTILHLLQMIVVIIIVAVVVVSVFFYFYFGVHQLF